MQISRNNHAHTPQSWHGYWLKKGHGQTHGMARAQPVQRKCIFPYIFLPEKSYMQRPYPIKQATMTTKRTKPKLEATPKKGTEIVRLPAMKKDMEQQLSGKLY